jgi:hypothetical protein
VTFEDAIAYVLEEPRGCRLPAPGYASRPAQTVTLPSGKPTFVATSHAAWPSFSVQMSGTTMIAPSRSIVQPACLAAASAVGEAGVRRAHNGER